MVYQRGLGDYSSARSDAPGRQEVYQRGLVIDSARFTMRSVRESVSKGIAIDSQLLGCRLGEFMYQSDW